ncbi:MAG: hypothetical protein ABJD68_11970 [Nakamurella sp.]
MPDGTLHSAAWQPARQRQQRIVRTASGLRVFALLVGVAVLSGRASSHR